MTNEPVPPAERKRLVELAEVAGLPWQRPHWLCGSGVFISDATAVHYAQLAANLAPRLARQVDQLEKELTEARESYSRLIRERSLGEN